ncbi:MAG: gamma-glutamyl-gamma-aminobutyrate hydrolase family protein, partial [Candidatus Cloacimonetes bacterium]|nr:gamma-glutamyl-gamma-aminobutyrate hydrolase family protein [Candidatus Cloacimonadota bacterium]
YPVHGKIDIINRTDKTSILLKGLPDRFKVARYHSLCCNVLNNSLIVTSETDDKIPMSLEDKQAGAFAVQFHPESFLSEYGRIIMKNFINEFVE